MKYISPKELGWNHFIMKFWNWSIGSKFWNWSIGSKDTSSWRLQKQKETRLVYLRVPTHFAWSNHIILSPKRVPMYSSWPWINYKFLETNLDFPAQRLITTVQWVYTNIKGNETTFNYTHIGISWMKVFLCNVSFCQIVMPILYLKCYLVLYWPCMQHIHYE